MEKFPHPSILLSLQTALSDEHSASLDPISYPGSLSHQKEPLYSPRLV